MTTVRQATSSYYDQDGQQAWVLTFGYMMPPGRRTTWFKDVTAVHRTLAESFTAESDEAFTESRGYNLNIIIGSYGLHSEIYRRAEAAIADGLIAGNLVDSQSNNLAGTYSRDDEMFSSSQGLKAYFGYLYPEVEYCGGAI